MNRSYRTEAIVIRRVNLGEADRILTLFTRDRGKISAIAKGSRRIKSSLSGSTELCSFSAFQIAVGTNLDIVTQAELRNAFLGLRSTLERISRSLYTLEFVAEFLEERQPHGELFDTLLSALYSLEQAVYPDWVISGFEIQAMALLGYAPQIRICVVCGRPVTAAPQRFTASLGGVVCRECAPSQRDSMRITQDAMDAMNRLGSTQLPLLGKEEPDAVVAREVRRLLRAHIRVRAEKEMKSRRFIERIRAEGADPELDRDE